VSLTIAVAGTTIPTDPQSFKSLQTDESLVFSLGGAWLSILDMTLGSVPATFAPGAASYDGPAVDFTPGGGITFGLQSHADVSVNLHPPQGLLTFNDGLDSPMQKSVDGKQGVLYLSLTLDLKISANLNGAYSGGAYGVTSAASASRSYGVSFYKAFAPTTSVREALAQVFESFALPLQPATFAHLADGDYLHHEFDGNLQFSFGAYAGVDKVLYAGHEAANLLKIGQTPLATFTTQTKPEVSSEAKLDVSVQYNSSFEAVLYRAGSTGRMHLYRSADRETSGKLTAGMTLNLNTTASVSSGADAAQAALVSTAGGAQSLGGQALSAILARTGVAAEVDKYSKEATDKLTAWLNRGNGKQVNLQAAIEAQDKRFLLAGYSFDLSTAAFPEAWKKAYNGDLTGALATGAVTLDSGSGLEQEYQRKTSISCNVFNLFKWNAWDQFSSNTSLVYAGNNVFHLVETVEHAEESDTVGTMKSMNLYFTAAADCNTKGSVETADIALHLDMTAKQDHKAIDHMAALLGGLGAGSLARDLRAFSTRTRQGTATLSLVLPHSAYAQITSTPYDAKGHALAADLSADAHNWAAFAQAADDLNVWPLAPSGPLSNQAAAFYKSFSAWEQLNKAGTGATTADRTHTGSSFTQWPEGFPEEGQGTRSLIIYSMLAGQSFMNFCASLEALARVGAAEGTTPSWEGLRTLLTAALKQESDMDFVRPAMLALLRLSGTTPSIVGPAPALVPVDHFNMQILG